MAAHIKKDLYPATVIATDTTTVSDGIHLHAHAQELILVSTVSSRTDGTFTVTLQHSPDGTNWTNVLDDGGSAVSTGAQSADGIAYQQVLKNVAIFPHVRASILSASTTSGATVEVDLYHGTQR
jgi:hypothetical protein